MFSGKTDELIRRMVSAENAKLKVVCVKPLVDTRSDSEMLVSHSLSKHEAMQVGSPEDILQLSSEAEVVAVDEAQFFGKSIVSVTEVLVNSGKRVIIAGLDMDYRGKCFGKMGVLMAMADEVVKLKTKCSVCGEQSTYSQRIADGTSLVIIGASESYLPRCREHYEPHSDVKQKHGIVTVEGIIGSGKSTVSQILADALRKRLDSVVLMQEPLNGDDAMLKLFLSNKDKYAFAFQIYAIMHRTRQRSDALELVKKGSTVILDRGINGDMAFEKMFHTEGVITDEEHAAYSEMVESWTKEADENDVTIFIEVSPESAMFRVNERNRLNESSTYDAEYLRKLATAYTNVMEDKYTVVIANETSAEVANYSTSKNDEAMERRLQEMMFEKLSR